MKYVWIGVCVVLLVACSGGMGEGDKAPTSKPQNSSSEQPVVEIPLTGPAAKSRAEFSGMAWYKDHLILLPQYPARFRKDGPSAVFTLSKEEILVFLQTEAPETLEPRRIPWFDTTIPDLVEGFEGYEALVFLDDRVFLTIESSGQGEGMVGYLVSGTIAPDLSEIRLDPDTLTEIMPQAELNNFTDEALVLVEDVLITLYEANGVNVNPQPVGHRFDLQLNSVPPVSFPNVEYRITDLTSADSEGRFWASNTFYPGDRQKLDPASDPLAEHFGKGETHTQYEAVERLLLYQYRDAGIELVDVPPIQFQLSDDGESRNWEGVVRLDDEGFLLVTDEHPKTILGFVAWP